MKVSQDFHRRKNRHDKKTVDAVGRTQAEKEYILKTILDHLPLVTGSEEDMNVYLIQANGHSSSSSADEFRERTNNLIGMYGDRSRKRGWLRTQRRYLIVVDGAFRDRYFDETFSEFNKWLCRLAKRVEILESDYGNLKAYEKVYYKIVRNTDPENIKNFFPYKLIHESIEFVEL